LSTSSSGGVLLGSGGGELLRSGGGELLGAGGGDGSSSLVATAPCRVISGCLGVEARHLAGPLSSGEGGILFLFTELAIMESEVMATEEGYSDITKQVYM